MEKIDVSKVLEELVPTTQFGQFETIWPEVEKSIARNIKLKSIWETLTENKVLSMSYVTFTRCVKKAQTKAETPRPVAPVASVPTLSYAAPIAPVIQSAETEDKSAFVSEASSALQEAQNKTRNVDYSKIALDAERAGRKKN